MELSDLEADWQCKPYRNGVTLLTSRSETVEFLNNSGGSHVAFLREALLDDDFANRTVLLYAEAEHNSTLDFLFLSDVRINQVIRDESQEGRFATRISSLDFNDAVIHDFFFLRSSRTTCRLAFLQLVHRDGTVDVTGIVLRGNRNVALRDLILTLYFLGFINQGVIFNLRNRELDRSLDSDLLDFLLVVFHFNHLLLFILRLLIL